MSPATGSVRSAPVSQGRPTDTAGPIERTAIGSPGARPEAGKPAAGQLRLEFGDPAATSKFALSLASLFSGIAEERLTVDVAGRLRDDLDLDEIQQRLRANRVSSLRLRLPLGAGLAGVSVALGDGLGPATVSVDLPVSLREEGASPLWLQADSNHLGPLPLLALPVAGGAFTLGALHALVAVGSRLGNFASARLTLPGSVEDLGISWSANSSPGALPVVGLSNDTLWHTASPEVDAGQAVAWFSGTTPPPPTISAAPPRDWWTRLKEILSVPHRIEQIGQLELHLRSAGLGLPPFHLVELARAPAGHYMVPPEDGLAVALLPTEDAVVVAVDLHQPPDVLEAALPHAIAHLALGHVRPCDEWGHWDTERTVAAETPHRIWDQEAREYVRRSLAGPEKRRVESLDQCTPREKAMLGLWRLIGEMLGENRRLHPAAERYQRAAYQRQAAQRLVSMVEEFGGAILCDGVGLGKTYVATTMMVHYANVWRENRAASPERQLADPFRITVLAPNSVVSTWRREALPGLAAFGMPVGSVRVVSHTKLSKIFPTSALLQKPGAAASDAEHLLLSDLVIVDEAHNFRSLAASRTKVLRDLLRVQPRREARRRVVLLTATPINNGLDDLRQEVSLLFSRPLWLSDAKTEDGYRRQAVKEVRERCGKACAAPKKDVAPLLVHGQTDAPFSDSIVFRDDLDFGPGVQRIGDYLTEQTKRLKEIQECVRAAAQSGTVSRVPTAVRIAEDLLDRVVVQRSRSLCKEIERQHGSTVELLFRPDARAPETLRYSDEYDGIQDVLARFLPLFDAGPTVRHGVKRKPLSLKVYMWYDVREGLRSADESSSVVGLQRVLILKRLESSPVSFLVTLVRLAVRHAYRLRQLGDLCSAVGDEARRAKLRSALDSLLARQNPEVLAKILCLATGRDSRTPRTGFVELLGAAYANDRSDADPDDPPPQTSLFEEDSDSPRREELDRLWRLGDAVLEDFETLLAVTPDLADIVFGKFDQEEWPHLAEGEVIEWPKSPGWGLRVVTDAKIRQLVARLVAARRSGQKVVVFSQFSHTVSYIQSVLEACRHFTRTDWQLVLRGGLGVEGLQQEEVRGLLDVTTTLSGATGDRDEVINAFAPFYRIGPSRPAADDGGDGERRLLDDAWEASWTGAMLRPVDVLLSTDVLAEGVNLQDVSLLVNYDVHWNPVRMIQRAGRIDRRLNPSIEHGRTFPDLVALAARVGRPVPRYYFHEHPAEPAVTVNMILPDELEAELLLRERIATKTLAIDFTLGLEQGTGAEADWMTAYKYQGITSLNSFQRDRAIEQIGGHHERLTRFLTTLGVRPEWAENLNGWFRATTATTSSPLVGRALIGRRGGELERFSRYLEPALLDGSPCWFWAEKRPGESMFDGWLVLDGRPENFPPHPRRDVPFTYSASTPLRAAHLLAATEYLTSDQPLAELPARDVGRPLMQGASALAAPKLGTEEDRRLIAIRDFYLLQLPTFDPRGTTTSADRAPASVTTIGRGDESNGAADAD